MFTPEGHSLEPGDMSWWSLACNIAREWRAMMDEARPRSAVPAVSPNLPTWSTCVEGRNLASAGEALTIGVLPLHPGDYLQAS